MRKGPARCSIRTICSGKRPNRSVSSKAFSNAKISDREPRTCTLGGVSVESQGGVELVSGLSYISAVSGSKKGIGLNCGLPPNFSL